MHDDFTCAFEIPVTLKFIFWGSHKEIVFGVITDN